MAVAPKGGSWIEDFWENSAGENMWTWEKWSDKSMEKIA